MSDKDYDKDIRAGVLATLIGIISIAVLLNEPLLQSLGPSLGPSLFIIAALFSTYIVTGPICIVKSIYKKLTDNKSSRPTHSTYGYKASQLDRDDIVDEKHEHVDINSNQQNKATQQSHCPQHHTIPFTPFAPVSPVSPVSPIQSEPSDISKNNRQAKMGGNKHPPRKAFTTFSRRHVFTKAWCQISLPLY